MFNTVSAEEELAAKIAEQSKYLYEDMTTPSLRSLASNTKRPHFKIQDLDETIPEVVTQEKLPLVIKIKPKFYAA
jgi:hypothetical protein